MPNYFSPDAKDLIAKLIQPNPLKRLTISEVMEHPWFNVNVPTYQVRYFDAAPQNQSSMKVEIDEEIVDRLYNVSPCR